MICVSTFAYCICNQKNRRSPKDFPRSDLLIMAIQPCYNIYQYVITLYFYQSFNFIYIQALTTQIHTPSSPSPASPVLPWLFLQIR